MVSLYRHIAKPVLMTQIGGWFYALKAFFFIPALPYSKIYFKTTTNLHKLFILIPFFPLVSYSIFYFVGLHLGSFWYSIWNIGFFFTFTTIQFWRSQSWFDFKRVKTGSIQKESMNSNPWGMSWKNQMNKLFCIFKDIPCTKCWIIYQCISFLVPSSVHKDIYTFHQFRPMSVEFLIN